MDFAELKPGQRALDFGSGAGGPTTQMAEMTGATFVGLTNTESLSQRARTLATDKVARRLHRPADGKLPAALCRARRTMQPAFLTRLVTCALRTSEARDQRRAHRWK